MKRKNRIAQWAFDTRPILGRFHLWLEDVDVEWLRGDHHSELNDVISFVDLGIERLLIMGMAVTALGTKLFGRYGEGAGLDEKELNVVKKDADAISAYALSESLWYLTRSIPENHAIMVCLGEGLMSKAGETMEMGANPLLGFGRIYARPNVAKFLDARVQRMINDTNYQWNDFQRELKNTGITIWGAAIDTLENTSRFAKGAKTGPMTVLHLFDQPMAISNQYEGYLGNLILPKEVIESAEKESLLIDFFTPREKVFHAIRLAYPDIKKENIHVWTLQGKGREPRIGGLWKEWQDLGVHLVDDDWTMPSGEKAFTESGTYAPTYLIGTWEDEQKEKHLFLTDGYAASAEAFQAASLYPSLDLEASLSIFSSKFKLPYDREPEIMHLDPDADDFSDGLCKIFGESLSEETIQGYRNDILQAKNAGIPLGKRTLTADDFMPEKHWDTMALTGYMLPEPYTGAPGVEQISNNTYQVTVRLSTPKGDRRTTFKLRLLKSLEESRLVFKPLLNRFFSGENYQERAVKISDSGRIRNELQTLCSVALEYFGTTGVRLFFDRIPNEVIPPESQIILREVLEWYKINHPMWFDWLELN
ncbi:MAG: hypothetical protein JRI53_01925 [Deltaproteobacteria bacterium]|nr:hypothetical protein [Deltaproteobacteria bacterium]